MKEIIGFPAWLFKNLSEFGKLLFSLSATVIIIFTTADVFGLKGVAILFGTIATILVLFLIFSLFKFLQKYWKKYQEHLDFERQRVVNRLKGEA